jgi:hypothetical protein
MVHCVMSKGAASPLDFQAFLESAGPVASSVSLRPVILHVLVVLVVVVLLITGAGPPV